MTSNYAKFPAEEITVRADVPRELFQTLETGRADFPKAWRHCWRFSQALEKGGGVVPRVWKSGGGA